jgi:hypothetical protein
MKKNCGNCVWAKARASYPDPGPMPEYVELTGFFNRKYTRRADEYDEYEWAVKRQRYLASIETIRCHRFPKTEIKDKTDLCGEHSPRLEVMTETELFKGLDKANNSV